MIPITFTKRLKTLVPKSLQVLREGYSWRTFQQDLVAGINVGIVAFPLALAISRGASVPPECGIIATVIAGFLISALGGTRVQIGGPTSTLIVILYGIMQRHGFEGLVWATLMAGAILIFFGLAGLGAYIKYIPYPVVTGLTTGIAVTIFSGQIKDFLGLQMGAVPIDFIGKWNAYWHHLRSWDPTTFLIGLGTLGVIIYFRKTRPRFPGTLIALSAAAIVTWMFNLDIATIGSQYGTIACKLPSFTLPLIDVNALLALVPDAMAIALLASIESLLAAVISEGMTGWKHQSNCELVAQGIANIGSVLFGGLPATGSVARTAVNVKAGACTPVAGMTHAGVVFLLMFACAPLMNKVPLCSLSAVLFMIAWGMSEIHHFIHLFTAPKKDIAVLLAVFILTVLINITAAVQMGIILAAILFMKQMSDLTDVVSTAQYFEEEGLETGQDPYAISKKEVPQGVEVYEINGPFFFGVADRLKNLLNEMQKPPKIFILRMRRVPTIDATGLHALEEFYRECKRQGTTLLLSGVKKNPMSHLKRYQVDGLIGEDRIFPHINQALDYARRLLQ